MDATILNSQTANLPPVTDVSGGEWQDPRVIAGTDAPLVTVVVITSEADREKWLADAIRSIPAFAEVVVCTTVKGDAESLTVDKYDSEEDVSFIECTYTHAGEFDFGRARNVAQQLAAGAWVFALDADERLVSTQHEYLRRILTNAPGNIGCYYVSMVIHQVHGRGKRMEDKRFNYAIPRIYRRTGTDSTPLTWEWCVHEQILPSVAAHGYDCGDTALVVVHEGYLISVEDMIAKKHRNLPRIMRQYQETPHTYLLSKLNAETAELSALMADRDADRLQGPIENV